MNHQSFITIANLRYLPAHTLSFPLPSIHGSSLSCLPPLSSLLGFPTDLKGEDGDGFKMMGSHGAGSGGVASTREWRRQYFFDFNDRVDVLSVILFKDETVIENFIVFECLETLLVHSNKEQKELN